MPEQRWQGPGSTTPHSTYPFPSLCSSLLRDGKRRELGPWVLGGGCKVFCLGSLFDSLLPTITPNQAGNTQMSCLHPDRQRADGKSPNIQRPQRPHWTEKILSYMHQGRTGASMTGMESGPHPQGIQPSHPGLVYHRPLPTPEALW